MRFSDEQLDVLKKCNELFDSDYYIQTVENGIIYLTIRPGILMAEYSREVGTDGSIWRLDADTDERVEATLDPLTGSYVLAKAEKATKYYY